MTDTVSQSWVEALSALLTALGVETFTTCEGPADLDAALLGQKFSASTQTLLGVDIPDAIGGGLLVELEDLSWVPLLDLGNGLFKTLDGQTVADLADWKITSRVVCLCEVTSLETKPLSFFRRYKGRVAEILFGGLLVNLLSLCFPLFGAFVYDKVLNNGITETLWALTIGLALVIGLDYSIRAIRALLIGRFTVMSDVDIDRTVFEKVLYSDLAGIPSIGKILSQYKQILGSRDFLSSGAMLAAVDIPFLVLFLVIIAWIGGWMVLVPILLGCLLIAIHALFSIPTLEAEAESRRDGEARFTLLADVLASRETVVGGHFADALRGLWRRTSLKAGETLGRSRYWHALAFAVSADFSSLAYVSTIVVGAHMIEAHALTSGSLLACTILTSRVMAALSSVVTLVIRMKELKRSLADLDATLPSPPLSVPIRDRGRLKGDVRLQGLTCRLRVDAPPALDNLNLQIHAGEVLGIAGHPGAGKTTMLRAIAGVLKSSSGEVLIDNIPLSGLSPQDVSLNIAYKPQEACLFDGTLEDNLCLGQGDVSTDMMNAALEAVGLMPTFAQGALSYTTLVGARGANLSGGQKQMVMLARALIGSPSILMLDEPTAGLDSPTEKHLAAALKARKGSTTLLICTHSREVLSICDRILVLDRGRIVAHGPRDKILGTAKSP